MYTIIEPCCYPKQLTANLEEAEGWVEVTDKETGEKHREMRGPQVSQFFSFSDWGTDELIPWTLQSVPGCEATLCLVQLDVHTIYVLKHLMGRTYISDGSTGETRPVVSHLTLITQTSRTAPEKQRLELREQLGKYINQGRVTVCEDNIGFRCIAASNGRRHLVVQGSLNQSRLKACTQMYTMTTSKAAYDDVSRLLASKARLKKLKDL